MPTAVASLSYQPFPSRVDSSPTMCATLEHQDGTSSSSRDMRQAEPADIEYSDSSSCESDDQQATDDEEEPELHSRTRVRDGGDAMDTTSDRMRSPQHASSAPATVTRSTRLRSASIAAMGSSNSGDADAGRSRADSSSDKGMSVRKGKWTPEEEAYTSRIIRDFNNGYLPLPPGTTLRTYLSDKLSCDPMRITKKFAGAACIGKRVFAPCEKTPDNMAMVTASKRDLLVLEQRFRQRIGGTKQPHHAQPHTTTTTTTRTRHHNSASPTPSSSAAAALGSPQRQQQRSASLRRGKPIAAKASPPSSAATSTTGGSSWGSRGGSGSGGSSSYASRNYFAPSGSSGGARAGGLAGFMPPQAAYAAAAARRRGGGSSGSGSSGGSSDGGSSGSDDDDEEDEEGPGYGHYDRGDGGSSSGGGGGGGRRAVPRSAASAGGSSGYAVEEYTVGGARSRGRSADAAFGAACERFGRGGRCGRCRSCLLKHEDVEEATVAVGGVSWRQHQLMMQQGSARGSAAGGGYGRDAMDTGDDAEAGAGGGGGVPVARFGVLHRKLGVTDEDRKVPLAQGRSSESAISDSDAGSLLLGFFKSVQSETDPAVLGKFGMMRKPATAHHTVHHTVQQQYNGGRDGGEQLDGEPEALHPLLASKRGARSISMPVLSALVNLHYQPTYLPPRHRGSFAHAGEHLPPHLHLSEFSGGGGHDESTAAAGGGSGSSGIGGGSGVDTWSPSNAQQRPFKKQKSVESFLRIQEEIGAGDSAGGGGNSGGGGGGSAAHYHSHAATHAMLHGSGPTTF